MTGVCGVCVFIYFVIIVRISLHNCLFICTFAADLEINTFKKGYESKN